MRVFAAKMILSPAGDKIRISWQIRQGCLAAGRSLLRPSAESTCLSKYGTVVPLDPFLAGHPQVLPTPIRRQKYSPGTYFGHGQARVDDTGGWPSLRLDWGFTSGAQGCLTHPPTPQKGAKMIRPPELAGNWAYAAFGAFSFLTTPPPTCVFLAFLFLLSSLLAIHSFLQTQPASSIKRLPRHICHSLLLLAISLSFLLPQTLIDNSLTFLSRIPSITPLK